MGRITLESITGLHKEPDSALEVATKLRTSSLYLDIYFSKIKTQVN